MSKSDQINARLDPDVIATIDAIAGPRKRGEFLRTAIAEKLERDAGGNPARVALAAVVWQLIELAVFYRLVTPAELLAEAEKYGAQHNTSAPTPTPEDSAAPRSST